MSDLGSYKVRGIPIVPGGMEFTTGNVFFVDSGSGNDNADDGDTPKRPLATLDYAIGRCTATNGDVIYLMPGHAETTTAIAADVAGISIIGIGRGRARPTITATTAASDLIDVTAANILIKNIRLVGAASGVTSLIALAATDFMCEDCSLEHGAAPTDAVVVTNNSSDRFTFKNCLFLGTAAGPDLGISFAAVSGDCQDYSVIDCTFNYMGSSGLDEAGIQSNKVDTGVLISGCKFLGMNLTAIDFNSAATGLVEHCSVLSLNATVAELMDMGNLGGVKNDVTYQQVSGVQIPVTTAGA